MANVLAIVTFNIYPARMGGQKGVADFYDHLRGFHDVFVACSADNDMSKASVAGKNFLFNNRRIYLNIFKFLRLKKLMQERHFDCIIAEHSFAGWIGRRLAGIYNRPLIIHNHNIEASRFQQMNRWWWRWFAAYEARILRAADLCFFISEEDRQYAVKQYRVPPHKTCVVPYGVSLQKCMVPQPRPRRSVAILYFNGTMDYKPNYDALKLLVTAVLPELEKRSFPYQLVVSGNRVPSDLLQLMQQHQKISFAGFVDSAENLYLDADVFVNPVINNSGVKTKVIEALACSCKVVSFVSGAAGVHRTGAEHLLYTVQDHHISEFAEAVIKMFNQDVKPVGDAFLSNYSWNTIAKEAATAIDRLINEHAKQ